MAIKIIGASHYPRDAQESIDRMNEPFLEVLTHEPDDNVITLSVTHKPGGSAVTDADAEGMEIVMTAEQAQQFAGELARALIDFRPRTDR